MTRGRETASAIVKHLVENVEFLDPQTMNATLRALNNDKLGLRDSVSAAQLNKIEDKIMGSMPEYINADLSQSLAGLLMLDHKPLKIISELNQMNKLSIFKID